MSSIIYKITNTVNGKCYIGFTTKTLEQRWKRHLEDAFRKTPNDKYRYTQYFYKAIRKYGKDAWTLETIIHSNDIDFTKEMEKFCIAEYDSANPENGYNSTLGGEGGIPNEATRRKISESKKGEKNPNWGKRGDKSHMWGRKLSEETRRKIGYNSSQCSEKTRRKISESQSGEKNHFYGKKHSPESRQRMSESRKRYLQQKNIKCGNVGKTP
jgi:group I intron endonuclease